ncbi:MAG: hypothetical protein EZS28_032220 [Streblomastix strix]|uniref:Uncharacterized protein n=1 Tax=Streblomastix strix TaxID=222440 RepID=A0A5J4UPJ6_9EUKA|nr:MAG: hypothetical protein EZS28_032220 [Streblomastix strix]
MIEAAEFERRLNWEAAEVAVTDAEQVALITAAQQAADYEELQENVPNEQPVQQNIIQTTHQVWNASLSAKARENKLKLEKEKEKEKKKDSISDQEDKEQIAEQEKIKSSHEIIVAAAAADSQTFVRIGESNMTRVSQAIEADEFQCGESLMRALLLRKMLDYFVLWTSAFRIKDEPFLLVERMLTHHLFIECSRFFRIDASLYGGLGQLLVAPPMILLIIPQSTISIIIAHIIIILAINTSSFIIAIAIFIAYYWQMYAIEKIV